jgi:small subunit ribosomal protein S1
MSDSDRPEPSDPPEAPTPPAVSKPGPEPERPFGGRARLRDLDKDMESELEAAMGGLSADQLLQETTAKGPPKAPPGGMPGRLLGRVLRVHGADVFIDVPGSRGQGVLPLTQFPEGPPVPGTEIEVSIEGYDRANGLTLLSRRGAAVEADWSSVAPGMIVEARVTATNKGGLAVDVNGIRGFLPISQIDLYRVEQPEQYLNQRLLCLVTEVDPQERNLVVSRRAVLEKEREEKREQLWRELAEGQVREGIVRNVREFGAFVDLGGVDGLIPVSEMSWTRVEDPTQVVQSGQRVKVVVLHIDHDKRKVRLGMKQLAASPWDSVLDRYVPGTVLSGKVTRLMDFGAFVELEPGIEGLIHISELAPRRVWRVSDVVKPGQEVQVKVLQVEPERRRIALSLKAALPEEPKPAEVEETGEEEAPARPPRPRTTPLRGGIGEQ